MNTRFNCSGGWEWTEERLYIHDILSQKVTHRSWNFENGNKGKTVNQLKLMLLVMQLLINTDWMRRAVFILGHGPADVVDDVLEAIPLV